MRWTWSDFLGQATHDPLGAAEKFLNVLASNADRWWLVLLTIAAFWVARMVMFAIIDVVVPHSLSEKPPRWATNRFMLAWRDRLRRETLETRSLQRSRSVVSLAKSGVDPVMSITAFLTVFSELGIEMSARTGGVLLGGVSLAIGLAFQDSIKDLIAGLTILMTDTFSVGDYVDTQFGVSGLVRHIGMRFTTLESSDGTFWSVRHSQIPKVGNLTAANAVIVTDVILTWNEADKHVAGDDLKFAETLLDDSVHTLGSSLKKMERFAQGSHLQAVDEDVVAEVAAVLPDLVPTMGADTLYDMRAITEEDDPHAVLKDTISQIPGRVPLFTSIEYLGFVESSVSSVRLRLRIILPPKSSRSQAMAALRRAIFDDFVGHDISVKFETVPESELPAL